MNNETINCGIGSIIYDIPTNLKLAQFMEDLKLLIEEKGIEEVITKLKN